MAVSPVAFDPVSPAGVDPASTTTDQATADAEAAFGQAVGQVVLQLGMTTMGDFQETLNDLNADE